MRKSKKKKTTRRKSSLDFDSIEGEYKFEPIRRKSENFVSKWSKRASSKEKLTSKEVNQFLKELDESYTMLFGD